MEEKITSCRGCAIRFSACPKNGMETRGCSGYVQAPDTSCWPTWEEHETSKAALMYEIHSSDLLSW